MIHDPNHHNKRLSNLKTCKACCCDDGCESVNTRETPIAHVTYGTDLQVANCEYLGKLSTHHPACPEIPRLVHPLQHIFRSFLGLSPQGRNAWLRESYEETVIGDLWNSRKMETEGTASVLQ